MRKLNEAGKQWREETRKRYCFICGGKKNGSGQTKGDLV